MRVLTIKEAENIHGGVAPVVAAAGAVVAGAVASWVINEGLNWLKGQLTAGPSNGNGNIRAGTVEVTCQGHLTIEYDAESNYTAIRCF